MADERNYYVICDDNCKFPAMTAEQVIEAIAEATGNVPEHVEDAFITKIKEQNKGNELKFWRGTQAQYNAIEQPDAGTYYIITDAQETEEIKESINKLEEDLSVVKKKMAVVYDMQQLSDGRIGFRSNGFIHIDTEFVKRVFNEMLSYYDGEENLGDIYLSLRKYDSTSSAIGGGTGRTTVFRLEYYNKANKYFRFSYEALGGSFDENSAYVTSKEVITISSDGTIGGGIIKDNSNFPLHMIISEDSTVGYVEGSGSTRTVHYDKATLAAIYNRMLARFNGTTALNDIYLSVEDFNGEYFAVYRLEIYNKNSGYFRFGNIPQSGGNEGKHRYIRIKSDGTATYSVSET